MIVCIKWAEQLSWRPGAERGDNDKCFQGCVICVGRNWIEWQKRPDKPQVLIRLSDGLNLVGVDVDFHHLSLIYSVFINRITKRPFESDSPMPILTKIFLIGFISPPKFYFRSRCGVVAPAWFIFIVSWLVSSF